MGTLDRPPLAPSACRTDLATLGDREIAFLRPPSSDSASSSLSLAEHQPSSDHFSDGLLSSFFLFGRLRRRDSMPSASWAFAERPGGGPPSYPDEQRHESHRPGSAAGRPSIPLPIPPKTSTRSPAVHPGSVRDPPPAHRHDREQPITMASPIVNATPHRVLDAASSPTPASPVPHRPRLPARISRTAFPRQLLPGCRLTFRRSVHVPRHAPCLTPFLACPPSSCFFCPHLPCFCYPPTSFLSVLCSFRRGHRGCGHRGCGSPSASSQAGLLADIDRLSRTLLTVITAIPASVSPPNSPRRPRR